MTILQVLWIISGVLLGFMNFPLGLKYPQTRTVRVVFAFVYALTFYTLTVYPIRYLFDR